jgi:Holliday junction resolvase YEN1
MLIRRTGTPAANPVEKAMFWRICNLLTLNIELVFVFDGPDVPPKPGRQVNRRKVNHKDRELLKELLKHWGIPSIDAPGEAEAECCNLEKRGIVDAVWSQDSDCLMFGCQLWLRDSRIPKDHGYDGRNKGHTKKDAKTVRVVRASKLRTEHRLRREGCVLFAMLNGGDYDPTGLKGCGAITALKAAKSGIGINLCNAKGQRDCDQWRERVLLPYLKREDPRIVVPNTFPKFSTLQNYNQPKISSDSAILNNPDLRPDFRRKVSEIPLLMVTSHRFNTWGDGYMEWVVPTLLTRFLADRDSLLPKEIVHGIELVSTPTKEVQIDGEAQSNIVQRAWKITFSPFGLTRLGRHIFENSNYGYWQTPSKKKKSPPPVIIFDPDFRVECDIPEYLLRKALPSELFDTPVPTKGRPTKRKRSGDTTEQDGQYVSEEKESQHTASAPSKKTSHCSTTKSAQYLEHDSDDELRLPQPRTKITTSVQPARAELQSYIGNYRQSNRPHSLLGPPATSDIPDQEELDIQRAIRMSLEFAHSASGTSSQPLDLTDL